MNDQELDSTPESDQNCDWFADVPIPYSLPGSGYFESDSSEWITGAFGRSDTEIELINTLVVSHAELERSWREISIPPGGWQLLVYQQREALAALIAYWKRIGLFLPETVARLTDLQQQKHIQIDELPF